MTGAQVLCIGDVMVDRFVEGKVQRISPESPVPVFQAGAARDVPGGAANVARNIAALGGVCTLIGVCGADAASAELSTLLEQPGITAMLHKTHDRPTTRKVRYVAQGQHMLRVDFEESLPIPPQIEGQILASVALHLPKSGAVVLSDYAKGVLTLPVIRGVIALAQVAGVPVIVDPKSQDFSRYHGATLLTPNAREAEAASGINPQHDDTSAEASGRACLAQLGPGGAVLITRSEKGMTLIDPTGAALHVPTAAREVFDVVGAGDTVIATLAAAVASGTELADAARLANHAAGIVVGKRGTATVAPDELIEAVERATQPRRSGPPVVLTIDEATRYAAARRAEGKRVGFTNGVFDIVHPGHISLLAWSRAQCDCLIVGLNADASVRRLKGPTRPVNAERDRAIVLGAFGSVDAVVIFEADTPIDLIAAIRPDVLVKGADYTVETIVGADLVLSYGGEVRLAELIPGASSSNIIARAQMEKSS
ncbi:D-glycero-beta-D-manno-heptose-7-phosphate kinase [Xinfangfangia sp. CPCC 101601]|uniref:Bifunctional protein HldE n=1 Tax=Pseudogemmobacter lacusdianii TaxID=3069608 RepID=A0ABU0VV97_9RHOB|nr:D-glycero-beta-D-manno-heptose-7-phosphate kinase [Xinfangfangia sp. CPCC 101601]MDQ2065659.1 D-glycero-beta-D-manno-heptose-7-phosphate kinase [Xinfangfangia sp. CPCC 101601]